MNFSILGWMDFFHPSNPLHHRGGSNRYDAVSVKNGASAWASLKKSLSALRRDRRVKGFSRVRRMFGQEGFRKIDFHLLSMNGIDCRQKS